MVPVDDTALAVTDTGGPGIPVVYLNGQFATQGYWRRVIAELGTGWRHITYDERARGRKSKRSADYSFEAAVRDVDAVLAARGVDRALVVGWSYGAFVAAHWASRNPGPCRGRGPGRRRAAVRLARRGHGAADPEAVPAVELVHAAAAPDGPDPADERRRRWRTATSSSARLARERELGPVLDSITVPTRYVVASGTSFGSKGDEQERIRASLDAVIARNPNIKISAKVASNHGAILKKDFRGRRRGRTRGRRPRPRGALKTLTSGLTDQKVRGSSPFGRTRREKAPGQPKRRGRGHSRCRCTSLVIVIRAARKRAAPARPRPASGPPAGIGRAGWPH